MTTRTALSLLLPLLLSATGGCDRLRGSGRQADPDRAATKEDQAAAQEDREASKPPRPARAAAPRVPGAAAAGPDAAALLTDAKVKGFIAYHREISGGAGELRGMVGSAMKDAKGDPRKIGMPSGPGTEGLAARGQTGLQKSGLTQEEVSALTQLLTPYYTTRGFGLDAEEALAKAKGRRPGILDGMHREQIAKAAQARAEFGRKHGAAALAVVDRYEREFHASTQAMMKSFFKKK
jgi:hypothetical protein